jgi:hypothetical protein
MNGFFSFRFVFREKGRVVWLVPDFEKEVDGDSWGTFGRGPFGWDCRVGTRYFCPA